jgi:hypothetical protein
MAWTPVDRSEGLPQAQDVSDLLASAGVTLKPSHDVALALDSAIEQAQTLSNRSFSVVNESRRYDGEGVSYLRIDPCKGVTEVAVLDAQGQVSQALQSTDYRLYPERPGVFRFGLERVLGRWPVGRQNLRVTATFGESVSAEVYEAIVKLAAASLGRSLQAQLAQGPVRWAVLNNSEEYAPDKLASAIEGWQREAQQVLARKRRLSF